MRDRPGAAAGYTLAELLVAIAVVGVVVAGVATLLRSGTLAYVDGTARLEAQQSGRVALERMTRELRMAGLDPRGVGFPALVNPGPTGFTIQNDLDGDGIIAGRGERITYSVRGRTLRRNAGGGAQPMMDGLESLSLTYLDGAGQAPRSPGEIRAVVIVLTAGSGAGGPGRVTMTAQVRLRNR